MLPMWLTRVSFLLIFENVFSAVCCLICFLAVQKCVVFYYVLFPNFKQGVRYNYILSSRTSMSLIKASSLNSDIVIFRRIVRFTTLLINVGNSYNSGHSVGISEKCIKLRPLAVIKG